MYVSVCSQQFPLMGGLLKMTEKWILFMVISAESQEIGLYMEPLFPWKPNKNFQITSRLFLVGP
jgi:hypothetical protein